MQYNNLTEERLVIMLKCLEDLSNGGVTEQLHEGLKNCWPISELIEDKVIKVDAKSRQSVSESLYRKYITIYDTLNELILFTSFFNNRQPMPFEKPTGKGKEQYRYVGDRKISFLEEDRIAVCYTTNVLNYPIVFWIAFSTLKRKRDNALQIHIEGRTVQENLLRWQFVRTYFKELSDSPKKVMLMAKKKSKLLNSKWHNVLFTYILMETIDFVLKESYPDYSIENLDLLLAHENINIRSLSQYFKLLSARKEQFKESYCPSFL